VSGAIVPIRRADRLFDILRILRSAKAPVTAASIADELEVTVRTVYRDVAMLQARRVPVEGAAGIGYVLRGGFDLPPLMFTAEEVEAIVVGLSLLRRTGDVGLQAAAARVTAKIAEVLPADGEVHLDDPPLYVSRWGSSPPERVDLRLIRRAIREEEKLWIAYEDAEARRTERTVKPLAILYYIEVVVLTAWCELRQGFRHFRADRIADCRATGERFAGEGEALRRLWREAHALP
jgi:predicted DNA-binding transcriptional regulator YafY